VLYGTGEGRTDPEGRDGLIASNVFPRPRLKVDVTIAGASVEVLYVGAAPQIIAGVFQLNVRIPTTVYGSPTAVNVCFGGKDAPTQFS
jgi:uncharacterized protein (TIGR03437 family)